MKCWSQQFTLEFIELLRSQSYLWDMQSPDYRSTMVRRRGYNMLMQKAREVDPGATVDDIKRKIKGLRTNLKKMERRVLAYQRCGLEHTPSLFYYEPLSFLLTQDRQSGKSVTSKISNNSSRDSSSGPNNEDEPGEEHVREVREPLTRVRNSEIMDCDVFGQYVAAKLVSISKLQRVYLEKVINDAIFQAELGNLSPTTRLFKEERFGDSDNTFIVDMSTTHAEGDDSEVVLQELVVEPYPQEETTYQIHTDDEQTEINEQQITVERPNVKVEVVEAPDCQYWNEAESQIVPEAGPSNVVTNEKHSQLFLNNGVSSPQVVAENVNRDIYIKLENGAVIETIPVEKVQTETSNAFKPSGASKQYVGTMKANKDMVTLKNVEFADDDLMKMCEDDGITIICVEESDSLDNSM